MVPPINPADGPVGPPRIRSDEELRRDGVVHDVNQMLSVIVGRAACLLDGQPDGPLRDGLDSILRASRDAALILKRLGAAAAPSGDSGDLRLRVDEALDAIRPPDQSDWSAEGVRGAWRAENLVPADLESAVPAMEVREVLQNLLVNALAVLPDGGRVVVDAETEGDRLRLRVADDGPGVAPADRENVFAAGFTGSGDSTRGVGLAAARQVLAAHGGRLSLPEPQPARGALFEMDLPRGTGASAAARAAPAALDGDLEALAVLVVEDEPAVRGLFADVLRGWRCRVALAPDAETARRDFEPGRHAVALVDWTLPGEQGLDLADWLRSRDPALAVILTTGMDRERELASVVGDRVDFTLVKPLDLDELKQTLAGAATLARARGAASVRSREEEE